LCFFGHAGQRVLMTSEQQERVSGLGVTLFGLSVKR